MVFRHLKDVNVCSYQPAGYFIASGCNGGEIKVWATENVDHTEKLSIQPISGPIRDIGWTGDNKRIVCVGSAKEECAKAFQWDTGASVGDIGGHAGEILSCAVKAKRPFRVATGGSDTCVNFFKGPPFKFVHSFKDHQRFVNLIRYSPDGSVFATACSDKTIYFFDGKSGEKVGEIKTAHKSSLYGIAFSPDSKRFLTCGADKCAKIWDVEKKEVIKTYQFEKDVEEMQLGCTWSKKFGPITIGLNGTIRILDEGGDGCKMIYYGHTNQLTDFVWDVEKKFGVSASYDGILFWDRNKGATARVSGKVPKGGIQCVCVVGKELYAAGTDRKLYFIDIEKKTFKKCEKVELKSLPNKMVLGKDGIVYAATSKGVIGIKGHKQIFEYSFKKMMNEGMSIDICGDLIAVGCKDKSVHLLKSDGSGLTEVGVLGGEHQSYVCSVKFSPDGKCVASGDGQKEIVVWSVDKKERMYDNMVFHNGRVNSLCWSDDSKKLLSSSADKNLILWTIGGDLTNKDNRIPVMAHLGGCVGAVFAGKDVISVGNDRAFKIWNLK